MMSQVDDLNISAVKSRQIINLLTKFGPQNGGLSEKTKNDEQLFFVCVISLTIEMFFFLSGN
jgi:hypothetical protein